MAEPAPRALSVLRRARRVETDDARRALAEALARETALTDRATAIEQAVHDARRQPDIFDREVFAAWLIRIRDDRETIAVARRAAEAGTEAARAALATRRLAETAAEEALDRAMALADAARSKREQAELEDVARAIARTRSGTPDGTV